MSKSFFGKLSSPKEPKKLPSETVEKEPPRSNSQSGKQVRIASYREPQQEEDPLQAEKERLRVLEQKLKAGEQRLQQDREALERERAEFLADRLPNPNPEPSPPTVTTWTMPVATAVAAAVGAPLPTLAPSPPQLHKSSSILKTPVRVVFDKFKETEEWGQAPEEELMKSAAIMTEAAQIKNTYFNVEKLKRFNIMSKPTMQDVWRVKIILTSMTLNPLAKMLGAIGHRVLNKFKYGIVHAAVQIGHVVLEWNDRSLVIPTDISDFPGESALIAIDVDEIDRAEFKQETVTKICELIVEWNVYRQYSLMDCNCQTFVDAILMRLNIKPVFSGMLGTFMHKLQTASDAAAVEFRYPYVDKKVNLVDSSVVIPKGGYLFRTHEELDEACFNMEAKKNLPEEDVRLLKAFDRVFWYRFFSVQQDQTMLPEERRIPLIKNAPAKHGCYFDNPKNTGTYCTSN